ncbi:MAG: GGDEF domain-containing protein [Snowella sp.]|nr:GGDEF domain-containing protein [Snowella sp.]
MIKTINLETSLRAMQVRTTLIYRLLENLSPENLVLLNTLITSLNLAFEEFQESLTGISQSREFLQREKQYYQKLFWFSPESYIITDCQGIIQKANQTAAKLLNLEPELLVNQPFSLFVLPSEQLILENLLNQAVSLGDVVTCEICITPWQGKKLVIGLTVSILQSEPQSEISLCWMIRNLEEQKQLEEQMLYDSLHDSLTKLPNRKFLLDRLQKLIQHNRRYRDHQFAILFIDLDAFKEINDNFSHESGDRVLQEVAQRLLKCVRKNDIVARLGGDEFVILLESIQGLEEAKDCAQRIQTMIQSPIATEEHQHYLSASIGIIMSNNTTIEPNTLLRNADRAMYKAKDNGKACYQVFDGS